MKLDRYKKKMEKETKDSVVEEIVNRFQERSRVGIEKYKTTLDRKDLSPLDWINHLQEEMMDGILYAQRLRREEIVIIPRNELIELQNEIESKIPMKLKEFLKKYL
jgi:hypothetical protein